MDLRDFLGGFFFFIRSKRPLLSSGDWEKIKVSDSLDQNGFFCPVGIEDGINPPERMIRNMYEKLPQELKERGAFCLWKYEERDGSRTKVPYQTNGLCADSSNKVTFTDYAIAVRHRAAYDGIGIGVFGDICAIDIDSCVENGVLSDMAKDIITRMNTYTEYSPSGTGMRILFKASLPAYDKDRYCINNRRIKLEVHE